MAIKRPIVSYSITEGTNNYNSFSDISRTDYIPADCIQRYNSPINQLFMHPQYGLLSRPKMITLGRGAFKADGGHRKDSFDIHRFKIYFPVFEKFSIEQLNEIHKDYDILIKHRSYVLCDLSVNPRNIYHYLKPHYLYKNPKLKIPNNIGLELYGNSRNRVGYMNVTSPTIQENKFYIDNKILKLVSYVEDAHYLDIIEDFSKEHALYTMYCYVDSIQDAGWDMTLLYDYEIIAERKREY